MASSHAHHATGWAAGIIAAALITHAHAGGPYHLWAIAACIAGAAGATAPDWLEVAWWSRTKRLWVTHRTVTHWGIGWVALLAWSYHELGHYPAAAVAFGFACGGLMHLFADWPNPLGVPWIAGRHSLNWWNSGHCDLLIVGASWFAAWMIGSRVWLHGGYGLPVFRHWLG
ncbi:metal-dependent hydrolase [Paraburkholderia phosphatilytica]|uniref:metal-dependent hydrolase n=1 Tax=Paraburkholderia phosphatilytica TaxID=2282883 RepID=UPI000E5451B6|nr:metal-dependent hydrolase [Paraburkholderia phosphatilytica]